MWIVESFSNFVLNIIYMRQILLIITCLLALNSFSQEKFTISGYVNDGRSGESLIGAKVVIPSINQGAITNTYGFYSLTVPAGTYAIEYRALGLDTKIITIEF